MTTNASTSTNTAVATTTQEQQHLSLAEYFDGTVKEQISIQGAGWPPNQQQVNIQDELYQLKQIEARRKQASNQKQKS